jgi:glycine/D-amino acid oxidase-like deaminating enzyme
LKAFGRTDTGRVRANNQDAFICGRLSENALFCVVCDGMGGVNGGNVASAIAVKVISDRIMDIYRESLAPNSIRNLMESALKAARHHGVHVSSGAEVISIDASNLGVTGVTTAKTRYAAPVVVNCAGAWAGQFSPTKLPTRPIKGHMLAVASPPSSERLLRHVVRVPGRVYLAPRSDGRIIIGSTLEEAGYDKRVEPLTIQWLHQAAAELVPAIAAAKMLETWAGLRPGTPDNLPMLGATRVYGYFVATGHYRDGILLAPITARLMAQVIRGEKPDIDLAPFAADRFTR